MILLLFLISQFFWQACSTTAYMTCICQYSSIHMKCNNGRLKCAANGPSCRSWPLCLTIWCGQVSLWWRLRTRTALCAQQVRKTQGECQPQSGSRCCFSKFQWPIVVSYQLCRTWLLLLNRIAITLVMNHTYTHIVMALRGLLKRNPWRPLRWNCSHAHSKRCLLNARPTRVLHMSHPLQVSFLERYSDGAVAASPAKH